MTVNGFDIKSKLGGGKASGGTVTDNRGDAVAWSGLQCFSHSGAECEAGIGMPGQFAITTTGADASFVSVQA